MKSSHVAQRRGERPPAALIAVQHGRSGAAPAEMARKKVLSSLLSARAAGRFTNVAPAQLKCATARVLVDRDHLSLRAPVELILRVSGRRPALAHGRDAVYLHRSTVSNVKPAVLRCAPTRRSLHVRPLCNRFLPGGRLCCVGMHKATEDGPI